MADETMQVRFSTAAERCAVSLAADRVVSEKTAFVGGMLPDKEIFYDEITAIYRYWVNDWHILVVGLLLLVIFAVVALAVAYATEEGAAVGVGATVLGGLGLIYCIYRAFVVKRDLIRVVSTFNYIECPYQPAFFESLTSRLNILPPPSSGKQSAVSNQPSGQTQEGGAE